MNEMNDHPAGTALEDLVRKLEQLERLGGEADLMALDLVVAERIRQFEMEGFTPAHDDERRREGQSRGEEARVVGWGMGVRSVIVMKGGRRKLATNEHGMA